MKLIIDIPDSDYKFLKDLYYFSSGRRNGKTIENNVINAIKNGIPYDDKSQDKWTPIGEGLPKEKIDPKTNTFEGVLCTTVWGDVRIYKFGKPKGYNEPHFWHHGIIDDYVTAWQYAPEPYKEIRWTDNLSVTSNGDIINLEGRIVGHINLEDIEGGAV